MSGKSMFSRSPYLVLSLCAALCAQAGPAIAAQPQLAAGLAGADAVAEIRVPAGMEARSTALLLSGGAGWTAELSARAERLSQLHTLVIGIDSAALLRGAGGDCHAATAVLPGLAETIRDRAGAAPRRPVLAASGWGAEIALLAAIANPDRFKGLVTREFGQEDGPCASLASVERIGEKAPVRWLDIQPRDRVSPAASLRGTKTIHPTEGLTKAFYRSYLALAGTDHAFDIRTGDDDPRVRDLPITLHVDAEAPRTDTYAIFLSGDGGWANFDEEVSDRLAAAGIPVVGISTLRYLWQERPPATIARDIERLDAHFSHRLGRRRVLLIGFSLGANVTPFYVPELSQDMQRRLSGIGLIAPEARTGFEIVVGGWLGMATGAEDVADAIAGLGPLAETVRVTCLHGTEETESPCPSARLDRLRRPAFPGGHHLGSDYDAVAAALLSLAGPPDDLAAAPAGTGGRQ